LLRQRVRIYFAAIGVILPYALFGALIMGGISLFGAVTDGMALIEVTRATYRGTAFGLGKMLCLSGYVVSLEFTRERLRHEFEYRFPRWWPAVGRIALFLGMSMAALWIVGDLAGEGLRGLWGMHWDGRSMVRGAGRMASAGFFVSVAMVYFEAYTMSRPSTKVAAR
jgi:hypothetical protein